MRLGISILRATARGATASGGETIAPKRSPAGQPTPMSQWAAAPTAEANHPRERHKQVNEQRGPGTNSLEQTLVGGALAGYGHACRDGENDKERFGQHDFVLPASGVAHFAVELPIEQLSFSRAGAASFSDFTPAPFYLAKLATCVDARFGARKIFWMAMARSRVLTCVRPHECSGSHAAGPYGSSRIGSKSEPRAFKHSVANWFSRSHLTDYCAILSV